MTDNTTPPDWVLIEAAERSNFAYSLGFIRNNYGTMSQCYRALCDMIAMYEQPPVDRKLLCAREACAQFSDRRTITAPQLSYRSEYCAGYYDDDIEVCAAIRAIELWEEGFGA